MRKLAMLISGLVFAALIPMEAAAGPLTGHVATPPADTATSIILTPPTMQSLLSDFKQLVAPDTFWRENGHTRWQYQGYRFTGNLPPALFYIVDLSVGDPPVYTAVFWEDRCGARTETGDCIYVRIRLRRGVARSLDELKPYLNGVYLENATLDFWNDGSSFYDILITPAGQ